jgi:hypothetical protein
MNSLLKKFMPYLCATLLGNKPLLGSIGQFYLFYVLLGFALQGAGPDSVRQCNLPLV